MWNLLHVRHVPLALHHGPCYTIFVMHLHFRPIKIIAPNNDTQKSLQVIMYAKNRPLKSNKIPSVGSVLIFLSIFFALQVAFPETGGSASSLSQTLRKQINSFINHLGFYENETQSTVICEQIILQPLSTHPR